MPRPTAYSEYIKDRICAGLVEGKPLIAIVEDDETMPTYNMVFKWLREIPEFAKDYAHARECQADRLSDEILQVSRQKPGVVVVESEFGSRTSVDSGEVAHRRLLVDSLKWTAAKMKPKKYGDAAALKVEGTGDDGRLVVEIIRRQNAPGTLPMPKMDDDGDG